MQHQAAQAYQAVAKKTAKPRELEASLLSQCAGQMKQIQDNWAERERDLFSVLVRNRQLWEIFASSVTQEDNPLPEPIKQNIANLGMFVVNYTIKIQADVKPEQLDVLININREIAAGLRESGAES